ncbi:MAG: hypothetical protein DBY35_12720 [Bacteroidales bacterium]|nr:MAG: hypothetical protein DBY35_12720 [Bacteroidales bacterium]
MTEQNKTTIQNVEPGIETMSAPNRSRKEKKNRIIDESKTIEIERKLLSSLGIHEADALAACIAIGAGNQESSAVKSSDRHRLNLYLNAGTNRKEMSVQELSEHRQARARQLVKSAIRYFDKEEMTAAMFTVSEIARCKTDIDEGVRMIQFYNSSMSGK